VAINEVTEMYKTKNNARSRTNIQVGKVLWFNDSKGYGLVSDSQGREAFIHYTEVLGGGFKPLAEGQSVTYELDDQAMNGLQAYNLTKC
jgi:CspA family cold shock protein